MEVKRNYAVLIFLRYLILLGIMFTLPVFYLILRPLTIHFSAFLLNLFYDVLVTQDFLIINLTLPIQIVSACVAGSAYLLLLILNLSVPMKPKKRAYSIAFSFVLLFFVNVLRILVFSILHINNFRFFDLAHKFTWYFLSTLFVVTIWFFSVKIFKIKKIPFYSDFKYFLKIIKS